jgi:TonB family protein
MLKKNLITLLFAIFYCLNAAQGQAKLDCTELKKRIDNAFTNSSTLRLNYWSEVENIQYEQDTLSNNHLIYSKRGGNYDEYSSIIVKDKSYFTKVIAKPDADVKWSNKPIPNMDFPKWTNFCKSASSVFNAPFKNCFSNKQISVAGTIFSIYSVDVTTDTFDIWINNTTDNLERINSANNRKKVTYEWVFNEPIKIKAPINLSKENKNYGLAAIPPMYSYGEYDGTERVYTYADTRADYKTGQMEMFKFLGKTIKYPKQARENGIQGTVYVGFVVEKDGKLSNIQLKRGITGKECNEEAIRVVKLMSGSFIPSTFEGQKVRQAFTLPIKFKLE